MAQPQNIKQALASSRSIASSHHSAPTSPIVKLHNFAVAQAVHQGDISLSLSPLLGCDYVFISHRNESNLVSAEHITTTIQELIEILELSPRQSVIISTTETLDGHALFTRHDYTWNNRRVTHVVSMRVTHQEQIDFMLMMFNCSSAC